MMEGLVKVRSIENQWLAKDVTLKPKLCTEHYDNWKREKHTAMTQGFVKLEVCIRARRFGR